LSDFLAAAHAKLSCGVPQKVTEMSRAQRALLRAAATRSCGQDLGLRTLQRAGGGMGQF